MDAESRRAVGRNESLFREVNEAIERGLWPGDGEATIRFRCECGELGCNEQLELAREAYERVRRHPRRFFVLVGHELPDAEEIVERGAGYVVVEKRGEAGEEARAADPR